MNKYTFEWRLIRRAGDIEARPCLVKVNELGGLQFWSAFDKYGDLYSPILCNKDRNQYLTIDELLPLAEAKWAVEKRLMDDGVILEGDILIDYTK